MADPRPRTSPPNFSAAEPRARGTLVIPAIVSDTTVIQPPPVIPPVVPPVPGALLAPTNLAATPGDVQVALTWTLSTTTGITEQRVYRDGVRLSSIAPVILPPPPPPPPGVPAAPTNLSAVAGDTRVTLTWNLSVTADVTEQRIYRNGVRLTGGTLAPATRTYLDTAVVNDTVYTYTVRAVTTVESADSLPTSVMPNAPVASGQVDAPTNLQGVASPQQIVLTWTLPPVQSPPITAIRLYRALPVFGDSGDGSLSNGGAGGLNPLYSAGVGWFYTVPYQSLAPTATTWTETGLTDGQTYIYAVRAYNGAVESWSSNQVVTRPQPVIYPGGAAGTGQITVTTQTVTAGVSFDAHVTGIDGAGTTDFVGLFFIGAGITAGTSKWAGQNNGSFLPAAQFMGSGVSDKTFTFVPVFPGPAVARVIRGNLNDPASSGTILAESPVITVNCFHQPFATSLSLFERGMDLDLGLFPAPVSGPVVLRAELDTTLGLGYPEMPHRITHVGLDPNDPYRDMAEPRSITLDYDPSYVYQQFEMYTSEPGASCPTTPSARCGAPWHAEVEQVVDQWNRKTLNANVPGLDLEPYSWNHGTFLHYRRFGDAQSYAAMQKAFLFSRYIQFYANIDQTLYGLTGGRLQGMCLSTRVLGHEFGLPALLNHTDDFSDPPGYQATGPEGEAAWFAARVQIALNFLVNYPGGDPLLPVSGPDTRGMDWKFGPEPTFMAGFVMRGLIEYDNAPHDATLPADPRIVPAIKTFLDWLVNNVWVSSSQAFMEYLKSYFTPSGNTALVSEQWLGRAAHCDPLISLELAPAFAWMWVKTGDARYRDFFDECMSGWTAVAGGWFDSKQFKQTYWWGIDGVRWRKDGHL